MWEYEHGMDNIKRKLTLLSASKVKCSNDSVLVEVLPDETENLWIRRRDGTIYSKNTEEYYNVALRHFILQFSVNNSGQIELHDVIIKKDGKLKKILIESDCIDEEQSIMGVGSRPGELGNAVFDGLSQLSSDHEMLYNTDVVATEVDIGFVMISKDGLMFKTFGNSSTLFSKRGDKGITRNVDDIYIPLTVEIGPELCYKLYINKTDTGYRLEYRIDDLLLEGTKLKTGVIQYIDLDKQLEIAEIYDTIENILHRMYYSDDYNRFVNYYNTRSMQDTVHMYTVLPERNKAQMLDMDGRLSFLLLRNHSPEDKKNKPEPQLKGQFILVYSATMERSTMNVLPETIKLDNSGKKVSIRVEL